ncbi:MAG: right-handed parallel beta-helix repeat-containing protein [Verrucomicrobia bacterium]|nr:right-handed parallel beta-helix repeat-containing protein [Verrucomicrobiota bacterium]
MKHTLYQALLLVLLAAHPVAAKDLHVSVNGNDQNDGSASKPCKTISAAANLAQPGDVITVHAGLYRERVSPPRGGESDTKRIVYQAAKGEKVEIKGSEVVKNWEKVQDDVWKVVIPNTFLGGFNPYSDLIIGNWYSDDGWQNGRQHHTGAVYLNGAWLIEAAKLEDVLKPAGTAPLWFGKVDKETTTIWAQFKGVDPNGQLVEINVRKTVFYPDKPGRNYITVRGFTMRHAATPWAPPTTEQIGLIGTHWSKGWIIENNVISHSRCAGVSLGRYGDKWDNKCDDGNDFNKYVERALAIGWNKETIGHHLVRNNDISYCEQAGIIGGFGAVFSRITGNSIHDIYVQRLFHSFEFAGIKFHGSIDTEISRNHIYRTPRGIWLDWMAQGTRVTANLCHDNGFATPGGVDGDDIHCEVNHGPYLIDNNLFLTPQALQIRSQGGAYVHNLIAGRVEVNSFDSRMTPFHKAHSTEVAGLLDNPCGDVRFHNNVFVQPAGLASYDETRLPVSMDGNVFLKGANPSKHEKNPLVNAAFDPALRLLERPDGWYLDFQSDKAWSTERTRQLVTTELLGKAVIPDLPFENPDGSPLRIDTDYFGKKRNAANPSAGPFETSLTDTHPVKVW